MIRRFADASFHVAFLNARDAWHARATQLASEFSGQVVTTDLVLLEVGNRLAQTPEGRATFCRFLPALRADPGTQIIPATRELVDRGFEMYQRRPDKAWSLIDCTSFVVMQNEDIAEAWSADHHFEQAGFIRLLKVP